MGPVIDLPLSEQLVCLGEMSLLRHNDPREHAVLLEIRGLTNGSIAWCMLTSGHWSTEDADRWMTEHYVPDDDIPF